MKRVTLGYAPHMALRCMARDNLARQKMQINNDEKDDLMKWNLLAIMIAALASSLFCVDQGDSAYGVEMSNDMEKMQEQLNNQVLSKPFSVADEAHIKSYIEDAQRRGEVAQCYKGKYWIPGYTCVDLRPHSYREYLACRYYYSYYGHYYP
jgi:hypothetical protein